MGRMHLVFSLIESPTRHEESWGDLPNEFTPIYVCRYSMTSFRGTYLMYADFVLLESE